VSEAVKAGLEAGFKETKVEVEIDVYQSVFALLPFSPYPYLAITQSRGNP
jgi:hypothetical protein